MPEMLYDLRRIALSQVLQRLLQTAAGYRELTDRRVAPATPPGPVTQPRRPEDFRPLEHDCFQQPYAFYRMLRDDYPVYQLPNGIYCISRYQDIVAISRDHENFSSNHQGVIAGLRPGQSIIREGAKLEAIGHLGVTPVDVLALSDPPRHGSERRVAHQGLNAHLVRKLEPQIESLCRSMMDEFIDRGQVEFMQEFGWRLPMRLIIGLLGFPESDYERIKAWCMHTIASQSGIATPAQLMRSKAEVMAFMRYCWSQYRRSKRERRDDLSGVFAAATLDAEQPMTDQSAVSALFQLLVAGSDASASSMGNALKLLAENPTLADEIRADLDKLPAFIEEVFRLESAFQGHFRWARKEIDLHGVRIPRESRLFLMWASGNRDERFFARPEAIDLQRRNGKRHLTFGHGVHACIGRELARAEIRIVLREFLQRTRNLRVAGETPFQASMFARTLLQLPVAFEPIESGV